MIKFFKAAAVTVAAAVAAVPFFMVFAIVGGPVGVAVAAVFAIAVAAVEIMDWVA